MDMAEANKAKYKAGFTSNSTKKDFVKQTPFKIVPGMSNEQMASMGMGKMTSHPTPKNSHK